MRISLIENGLDSLRKGYQHLNEHENLELLKAQDAQKFSSLKDSILNIQHGVEILFKHLLVTHNEFLLYTDISRLKEAYRSKAKGEISELYEAEGVHTVTFKESIDRLRDICGIPISEQLKKKLLKVESWRNKITHSAAIITEDDVAKTLLDHLFDLDELLAPILGEQYYKGQGRTELDRAYNLTKKIYGELKNKIKAQSIEALISALRSARIKNVSPSGVMTIKNFKQAHEFLLHLQKDGKLKFSCDVVNSHTSGHAVVIEHLEENYMTIYTTDNQVGYKFRFAGLVVYIPEIKSNVSPLIFLFSSKIKPKGSSPVIDSHDSWTIQKGIVFDEDGSEDWTKVNHDKSIAEVYSEYDPTLPPHKDAIRILTSGLAIYMNVQKLNYPSPLNYFNASPEFSADTLADTLTKQIEERARQDAKE
ncbi:hypothetical protein FJD38_00240 [Pseudomonas saxonica]|uniref:Uncharacterized protein n=1 Tax=Pseudomonas saxonica TaxID=2600598 RepID=A0ABY3GL49_9PSED|nr:hypothetical protein [Pseudomonas saxonica]TWR92084.1 hypothetical protein FJD38_00240 [Pseudomonas saxonica]